VKTNRDSMRDNYWFIETGKYERRTRDEGFEITETIGEGRDLRDNKGKRDEKCGPHIEAAQRQGAKDVSKLKTSTALRKVS